MVLVSKITGKGSIDFRQNKLQAHQIFWFNSQVYQNIDLDKPVINIFLTEEK